MEAVREGLYTPGEGESPQILVTQSLGITRTCALALDSAFYGEASEEVAFSVAVTCSHLLFEVSKALAYVEEAVADL